MTRLLVEDLLSEGPALIQEAMSILAASEDDRVRMLTSYLPSIADDPWRMVATGEYNAGKSTLLKALTGDPRIKIDSDIATEEATEYTWNHILLVDTPGVAAGRDLHDERAEAALRDADLVLFVLTVALFDDVTEQHFRHVAHELGKLRQMIVVINKSTQMAAVPGVRADAVQGALGDTHQMPPIVECDGLAMLRAETEADPERRDFEENRSGRAAFLGTLNAFVRAEGTAGRLRKPFDAILALVNDARPLLEPDEAEAALSSLLDRRRESVAVSRLRVVNALEAVYGSTTDAILAAGEAVIVSAQDGVPQSTAVDAFDRAAKGAAEALEEKVKRVFANELVNLQADERGLIAGPEMQILDALSIDHEQAGARFAGASSFGGIESAIGAKIREFASAKGAQWLQDSILSGSRGGSPMHDLVTTLGHGLGYKFKPWEAVRWAKRLNVAAQIAMTAFQIHQEVNKAYAEERRERAELLELRRQVKIAAEGLIEEAREEVEPLVQRFYEEVNLPVVALEKELAEVREDRSQTAVALRGLESRSRASLLLMSAGRAEGSGA